MENNIIFVVHCSPVVGCPVGVAAGQGSGPAGVLPPSLSSLLPSLPGIAAVQRVESRAAPPHFLRPPPAGVGGSLCWPRPLQELERPQIPAPLSLHCSR